MNFNSNNNPKFYDESNPIKKSYTSNDITYDIEKNAGCNVQLLSLMSTVQEHILKLERIYLKKVNPLVNCQI